MASLKDILQIEGERDASSLWTVHLFKEGSFWRAYEWSAWLFVHYITEYQLTHRRLKQSEDTYILLGFPETSLNRIAASGHTQEFVDEHHIKMIVSDDSEKPECSAENWQSLLNTLKDSIALKESAPAKEQKKNNQFFDNPLRRVSSMSEIGRKILAYPLESRSPLDAMQFIAELKNDVSSLF